MKTITKNQNNVIECTCGTVLEYDKYDLILKGVEKTDYYAISVVCPACGKVHTVKPTEFVVKYLSLIRNDGRWMWYASDDFGHGGFVDFMRNYTWYLGNDKCIAEKYLKELQGEK